LSEIGFREALTSQPSALRRSEKLVRDQLSTLDPSRWRGGRVIACGLGASYHAAVSAKGAWEDEGQAFEVHTPSQLSGPLRPTGDDLVVVISQSGRSAEVLRTLDALEPASTILLSADPGSPAAKAAGCVIDLGVSEDCPVRVVGFSASVVALVLMARWRSGRLEANAPSGAALSDLDERAAAGALATERALGEASMVDVVAPERFVGVAGEGALLLREGARLPASAFETHQYLHGPLEAAGPACGVLAIGGAREAALAEDLGHDEVPVALVQIDDAGTRPPRSTVLSGTGLELSAALLVATWTLQHLTGVIAERRGLEPGQFRRAQRDTKVD